MEENSGASTSEEIVEVGEDMASILLSLQDLRLDEKVLNEDRDAALTIVSMKHICVLSSPNLQEEVVSNEYLSEAPRLGQGIDGRILPHFPPVQSLRGIIGRCSTPFEKQLTNSDLKDDQSRLILTKKYVESTILPLLNSDENYVDGIQVTVYDTDGKTYDMVFKVWASNVHVLTGNGEWKRFYKEHNLQAHQDCVTIWMFRHRETCKLCFVITSKRFQIHAPLYIRRRSTIKVEGKAKRRL